MSSLLAGCSRSTEAQSKNLSQSQINVVTTTTMVIDLVQIVGAGCVSVTGLKGPGIDPHLYKASKADVRRLAEADIVFYNGIHLEAKLTDVFERMGGNSRTVAVTDGIERKLLLTPPEFEGTYDPHVWFDVSLWSHAVEYVRDTLSEIDPAHAEIYAANAASYLAELQELDRCVKGRATTVPQEQRVLVIPSS